MEERVVLITGASSGIGLACAQYLASRGYRVYGGSRRGGGEGFTPLRLDVRDDASAASAVQTVLACEGRIDVLVNNAGIGLAGAIEQTALDSVRDLVEVNFFGALRMLQAVLPVMRGRRSGYVVNIGSIAGLIAVPFQGCYSASKFALEGLTEALRIEARPFGIRVVLIEPGDHRTGFTQSRIVSPAGDAYRVNLAAATGRMAEDEQSGPGPEGVARLLERILRTRNPRMRYTVGPFAQRMAAMLKRCAPNRAMERAIRLYYGV